MKKYENQRYKNNFKWNNFVIIINTCIFANMFKGSKLLKYFLKLNTSWSTILFTINYVVFALEIF